MYLKSSIKPPPPRGGLNLIETHLKGKGGGLIETGGLLERGSYI